MLPGTRPSLLGAYLPGMYLLHTERVERLIYTQVDTPGNEFGKGIIK